MSRVHTQHGFTLLELMLVVVIMVPLFGALAGISASVTSSVDANDKRASAVERARRSVQRLSQLLRPARLSSIQVQANADDVAAARASAVGQWISPVDLSPRSSVRFFAAEGLLSMNAALSTPRRQLTFELESGETANGIDDDGDGLVDEGRLLYVSDTVSADLGRFEMVTFTTEGSLLRISLRVGISGANRRIYRASVEHAFHIRNT